MFERLLDSIDDDYLRYITHIEAAAPGGRHQLGPLEGELRVTATARVAGLLRDDGRGGGGRGGGGTAGHRPRRS